MDNEEIYLNALSSSCYPNLDKLFSFLLEGENENVNLTSGAYFSKIVNALIRMN
jgi:hypothetical protein